MTHLTKVTSPGCVPSAQPQAMLTEPRSQLRFSVSDPVGGRQGESVCESVPRVYSVDGNILGLHTHSPHSLTHPEQRPVLHALRGKCPVGGVPFFKSFIPYLYCAFSLLTVFRYTYTYHYVTIACSTQYNNKL